MLGRKKKYLSMLALVLAVSLMFTLAGCGGNDDEGVINDEPKASDNSKAADSSQSDQIIKVTDAYLSAGKAPTISADEVYDNIVKGGDTSYFLLSIRKAEDDAKGQIEGALNIPYGQMFKKENLAKIPKDKKIVVICYTGHTASQVSMLLNQLGYEAYAMKFGMMGWTSNAAVLSTEPFSKAPDFETVTEAADLPAANDLPVVATSGTTTEDVILAQTEKYLTAGKAPTISADDVYNKVVKGKDSGYVLLSIRKAEDYAKGHIEGAINIPYGQLAKEENLKKLPKDKKIVVICYTGHTASYATMFLNQLGYDAYAMKFGMMGWTSNAEVLSTAPFDKAPDYPTVAGN